MMYQQKTFTLPAGGKDVSQRQWDYAILSREDFVRIYGEHTPEPRASDQA